MVSDLMMSPKTDGKSNEGIQLVVVMEAVAAAAAALPSFSILAT